ncbi:hypothetical protein SLS58_007420 [Diplodia intermedia]|uniref:Uncharacterized protein n=1 Tax=Diplodia intermedia TaxID=856260 RepID=A0ABR3TKE0_9PEZI
MSDPASSAMKPRTIRRADGPQAAARNTVTLHENMQEPPKMRTKRRADDLDDAHIQEPPRKTIKRRADAPDAARDIVYDIMPKSPRKKIETGDLNHSKKHGPPCDPKDEIAEEPLRKKCKKEERHPSDAAVSPPRSTTAAKKEEVCNQFKKVEIPPTANSLLNKTPQQKNNVQHGNTADEHVTPLGNMADDTVPNPSRKRSRSPSPGPANGRIPKDDDAMPEPPKKRLRPIITVKNISNTRTPLPKTTSKKGGKAHEPKRPAAAAAAAPKHFRWADLPGELKNLIYKHALTTPAPIDAHKRISFFEKGPTLNLVPALLRLNKQTYAETAPILYGENTFTFTCEEKLAAWLRRADRSTTPPPPSKPTKVNEELALKQAAAARWGLLRRHRRRSSDADADAAPDLVARTPANPWGLAAVRQAHLQTPSPSPASPAPPAPPLTFLRHLALHLPPGRHGQWSLRPLALKNALTVRDIYHTLTTRAPRLETFDLGPVLPPPPAGPAGARAFPPVLYTERFFARGAGAYVGMARWLVDVALGRDVARGGGERCVGRLREVLGRAPPGGGKANADGDVAVMSLPDDVWGRHFWTYARNVRACGGEGHWDMFLLVLCRSVAHAAQDLDRAERKEARMRARMRQRAERMRTAEGRAVEERERRGRREAREERREKVCSQREMDRLDGQPCPYGSDEELSSDYDDDSDDGDSDGDDSVDDDSVDDDSVDEDSD